MIYLKFIKFLKTLHLFYFGGRNSTNQQLFSESEEQMLTILQTKKIQKEESDTSETESDLSQEVKKENTGNKSRTSYGSSFETCFVCKISFDQWPSKVRKTPHSHKRKLNLM
jgi:hypothetical protein